MQGDYIGVEHADDVRVIEPTQEHRFAQHLLDFFHAQSWRLEYLHRLAAEELMLYSVNLCKRTFAKKALDLIGVADCLALVEQRHAVE
jgi:hypothetical protein